MYIPNPYFPNIPQLGNLILDYVMVEDGYPILFVCKNGSKLYLCVCRTTIPEQKWIISEVNIDILLGMAERKIAIAEAFKHANKTSCIAKWSKNNPKEQYYVLPTCELEDSDLPNYNLYLNEDDANDAMDYVKGLILQIQTQAMHEAISQIQSIGSPHYITPHEVRASIDYSCISTKTFAQTSFVFDPNTQCSGNTIEYGEPQSINIASTYDNRNNDIKVPLVA